MRRVDSGDIGVLFECPLYLGEIGKPVDGEAQINMQHGVSARHRGRTRRVRAVVDNQQLFIRRDKRADTGIHADRSRAAEKDGRPVHRICADDPQKIRAEIAHESPKLLLARTDVGDELCRLDRVRGRCGTGVEENVAFDVHSLLPIHKAVEDEWCVPVTVKRNLWKFKIEIVRCSKIFE